MENNEEVKVVLTMSNGYDNAIDQLFAKRDAGETVLVSDEIALTLADNSARIAAKQTLATCASLAASCAIIGSSIVGLIWLKQKKKSKK